MYDKMRIFNPIYGADLPTFTMRLRDIPVGYHITDIVIDGDLYPKTYAIKDRILSITEKHYRNFQVNGETVNDFFENIQQTYDENAIIFEKILSIYPTLDILVGSNSYQSTTRDSDKSNLKSSTDITDEKSVNSGNKDTITQRTRLDNRNLDTTENNKNVQDNVSSSSSTSTENKTNSSENSEKGSNSEQSNTANSQHDVKTHSEIDVSLDSTNLSPHSKTIDDDVNDRTENGSKNSEYSKTNNVSGSDKTDTSDNANFVDNTTITEDKTRSEKENINGSESQITNDNDSSERTAKSNRNANSVEDEKTKTTEIVATGTNRVGNEQPIDIFDNFIKKYPNIIKIFISYFKDDFVIYESGIF